MDMYELLGRQNPENVLKELSIKFKECRKNKKITQLELSNKSHVSYATIRKFEQTGKISLESLVLLAESLDMIEDFKLLFNPSKHLSYEVLSHGR